jgi:hypothetical protein
LRRLLATTRERTWEAPTVVPRQDRLVISAINVRSLTIDPVLARVTCRARLDIDSDGPLKVTLRGCPN